MDHSFVSSGNRASPGTQICRADERCRSNNIGSTPPAGAFGHGGHTRPPAVDTFIAVNSVKHQRRALADAMSAVEIPHFRLTAVLRATRNPPKAVTSCQEAASKPPAVAACRSAPIVDNATFTIGTSMNYLT
jgi:hypothetical protein